MNGREECVEGKKKKHIEEEKRVYRIVVVANASSRVPSEEPFPSCSSI